MYLKRLDVHGFKSFATRTSFEFGQGITAIVGPNGSGKSNIADALRWVLGEQSGRLLRARKLDDIIYAGSAKRPAADKVEVVLSLDNTDGWLPLDFREVAISRRGYRSGEADYLINRKRVRLRDIQHLLLRANAGQNSYAIIGQGLVETVLNLRPDERRQLIEEAADIQRYRLRIEEAQNRLAGTHENVERVKLLIKEIAPRVGQLERQAKRAIEHARLAKELAQALRVYYEHQWHRGQEAIAVARAAHDQSQAEFTQARVALETCQRELADVTSELDERRNAAAAVAAERDRLEQRQRELERRLAVARDRRSILEARRQELRDELAAVEGERDGAAGTLAADDSRRGDLEQAVAGAREALELRQAELSTLEEETRDAQTGAADAAARSKRLLTAAAELEARARRLDDSQRDLERDFSRLDTRRRSLVSQMAEQLRVLRGYRAQEEHLAADVSHVSARRQALEVEVGEARESLAKVEANQNARRGKLEALEARLQVLDEAQKHFQAAQPDAPVTVEGALAAVYQIMRVPHGLEQAIAAALAENLEALVFPREAQAVAAARWLQEQRAPRTTLIPLDAFKQVYPLNLMREKGILGVASGLIKYQPQYEKLVHALLGRTISVQDVATAARVVRR
ncbi:MAG TPA: chromosome segregation SMC family protein, partial [Dehalococcoidia bacterium]|nr:chromosome segregation SMC family protein [Dehalococcoidia bacterium]